MSDEEILKISYKKPYRFGELYDRHSKRFLAIAKRTLRSEDDAEDAVQEAFIRIYKYGKKFSDGGGKFRPWANTILKNCLADQINKYKNSTVTISDELENTSPYLSQSDEASIGDADYVRFILNKMDNAAAEVISLRYILGKSFKEIAKILNIKSNTARVRVYRSKKMFAEAYAKFDQNGSKRL